MQNKTDAVDQTQSTPRKFKGLKMALCLGLAMGGALLLTPTQQAEAGGCYSGYGYGGGYGYSNYYPSYRSGFSYSSPGFGIGIYSGGRGYGGRSYYGGYRSGYRGGYGNRGFSNGYRGHGHRGHGHRGGHGRHR